MFYKDWKPLYEKIINDLDLNFKKDKDAAILLDILLTNKKTISVKKLENLIKNKEVIIFGAGHSLEKSNRTTIKSWDRVRPTCDEWTQL